jgi:hypothetical protein
MMFVGDKGKILAGFNVQAPKIISGKKMDEPAKTDADNRNQVQKTTDALSLFVDACKTGKQYPVVFRKRIFNGSDQFIRCGLRSWKLLKYDASSHSITNVPDANKYLSREYRSGWDPATI